MLTLRMEKRDLAIKPATLRKAGKIPAVYYGPKEDSTPVVVPSVEFKKVWKQAGESSVIMLTDVAGNEHEVLIHDIDVHPLSGEPRHADFYVIEKGKKVKVSIPLIFGGVSPAVKEKGGILIKVRREIEVEAAPRDLPRDIRVDISSLAELSDVILAKDLIIPAGVQLKIGSDEVVASVSLAKEEVEEAPAAIDMSAIEVETKGKEIKEGETAPAADAASADKQKDKDKKAAETKKPEAKK
ncbi:MAG: large subunit ribosomal protein [Candidatus Parcubacteria bacterium]|jgi:large subunit ribosomal protein L25|nr:large subunit ribosomal protein [Candidatus Parcubacteria bacterium]